MATDYYCKQLLDKLYELTLAGRLQWSQIEEEGSSMLGGLTAHTRNHAMVLQHHGIAPGNLTLIIAKNDSTVVYAVHGMHISPQERLIMSELWRTALEAQVDTRALVDFLKDLEYTSSPAL